MQTYSEYLATMKAYKFDPLDFETWKSWQIHWHGRYLKEPNK